MGRLTAAERGKQRATVKTRSRKEEVMRIDGGKPAAGRQGGDDMHRTGTAKITEQQPISCTWRRHHKVTASIRIDGNCKPRSRERQDEVR